VKSTKGLSNEECKQLYFPDDLKSGVSESELKESLLIEENDYGLGATILETSTMKTESKFF